MSRKEFCTLVHEYSAQVLSTAVRILGDAGQAEDVHQEVFLAIWRRWHTYNGRTNWSAYLHRVTVRKAMEYARRAKPEQSSRNLSKSALDEQKPEELLMTAEVQQMLAQHLARLPKRQSDVFVLSRIEGLGAGQIAEILGCSPGSVRVHLHRAVKRLARELGDYVTERRR